MKTFCLFLTIVCLLQAPPPEKKLTLIHGRVQGGFSCKLMGSRIRVLGVSVLAIEFSGLQSFRDEVLRGWLEFSGGEEFGVLLLPGGSKWPNVGNMYRL